MPRSFARPFSRLAATSLLALGSLAAHADTTTNAVLYWDTFASSIDNGAAVSWIDGTQFTYGHVYTATHAFDSRPDWNGHADFVVSGDASTAVVNLANELSASVALSPALSNVNRYASFTLDAGSTVSFSVSSALLYSETSLATSSVPVGGSAGASVELQLFDTTSGEKLSQTTFALTSPSVIGGVDVPGAVDNPHTVTLSYTNSTGSAQVLEFAANANAYITAPAAVPEPSSVALLLGGLAIVGFGARKRRHTTA